VTTVHEDLLWLDCPDCGDVQAFERPSCNDGPADDQDVACPEWCCTVCGAGVVEWMAAVRVVGRARRKLRGVA
jgi:hypothetical protein